MAEKCPPPGKPVTFYECHPEDHAPAPSVRADLIELLAGYVAAFLWGGLTAGRYVVMYIDNEASRLALIKAYSSTQMGNVLVQMFVAKEDASQWKVWFGRVCSHSNIADAPSRMEVEDLVTRGAVQDKCAWGVILLGLEETEHNFGLG